MLQDGYQVNKHIGKFTLQSLAECDILVIANALHESNVGNWVTPNPSAFTKEEIALLDTWIAEGGALLLIADHMPFPGAAEKLAAVFGFQFYNGFALDTLNRQPSFFRKKDQNLHTNIMTMGLDSSQEVSEIVTFTGQAFQIPSDAQPILEFGDRYSLLLSDTAWVFSHNTQKLSAKGMYQAAFKEYGKGRVVVAGEAAMFSAQLAGPRQTKIGMNAAYAKQNYRLLLNIMQWLAGL